MKPLRVTALSILAGSTAILLAVGSVSAAVIEAEHYAGTDAFSYTCGAVTVNVDVEFSGVAHFRVGKGPDAGAFFVHDNYEVREVHTASNGEVLVIEADGLFQETKATRLSGNVFEFNSVNAGQPFIVHDGDGNLVLRDRGVIRETIVFDTLGDDTPGGTFIESVAFEVSGPHPGLLFDPCSLLG